MISEREVNLMHSMDRQNDDVYALRELLFQLFKYLISIKETIPEDRMIEFENVKKQCEEFEPNWSKIEGANG